MISLLQLGAELGGELAPCEGADFSAKPITGVHVSELEDPTPYLEGGELLLTTGMPFAASAALSRAYMARLEAKNVHAVGLGLGPWLRSVPGHVVAASLAAGIELAIVPDGVPFQNVTRAYWRLATRDDTSNLMDSLGTQTALARAAMRPDATSAVVRGLGPGARRVGRLPAGRCRGGDRVAGLGRRPGPRPALRVHPLQQGRGALRRDVRDPRAAGGALPDPGGHPHPRVPVHRVGAHADQGGPAGHHDGFHAAGPARTPARGHRRDHQRAGRRNHQAAAARPGRGRAHGGRGRGTGRAAQPGAAAGHQAFAGRRPGACGPRGGAAGGRPRAAGPGRGRGHMRAAPRPGFDPVPGAVRRRPGQHSRRTASATRWNRMRCWVFRRSSNPSCRGRWPRRWAIR